MDKLELLVKLEDRREHMIDTYAKQYNTRRDCVEEMWYSLYHAYEPSKDKLNNIVAINKTNNMFKAVYLQMPTTKKYINYSC